MDEGEKKIVGKVILGDSGPGWGCDGDGAPTANSFERIFRYQVGLLDS